jgi:hypothetical protein
MAYDGSTRYLLFAFLPNCAACHAALPAFKEIATLAEAHNVRVRYLSLGSREATHKFVSKLSDHDVVLMMPSKSFWRAYRVASVPQFMLVSKQGVVEWTYNGVMPSEAVEALRSMLRSPTR